MRRSASDRCATDFHQSTHLAWASSLGHDRGHDPFTVAADRARPFVATMHIGPVTRSARIGFSSPRVGLRLRLTTAVAASLVCAVRRGPSAPSQGRRIRDYANRGRAKRARNPVHSSYRHDVRLDFIRPGKPVENAFIEGFNRKLRDECLNSHVLTSVAEAQVVLDAWREDYKAARPHSDLQDRTPRWAQCGSIKTPGSSSRSEIIDASVAFQLAVLRDRSRGLRPDRTNQRLKPEDLALSV